MLVFAPIKKQSGRRGLSWQSAARDACRLFTLKWTEKRVSIVVITVCVVWRKEEKGGNENLRLFNDRVLATRVDRPSLFVECRILLRELLDHFTAHLGLPRLDLSRLLKELLITSTNYRGVERSELGWGARARQETPFSG